jgi:predicted amidohydrolase YtcJ
MKHYIAILRNILFLIFLQPFISFGQPEPVDILIVAKKVYTAADPKKAANCIAVKDGKILAVGEKAVLTKKYAALKIINEPDKFIYPGFIDAHCHLSGYALDKYKCELVGTTSYNEVIQKLLDYEKTNKLSWIYGRGWDQNDWVIKEFPTKDRLDSLFRNKPVILKRIDGHAILCNQKALDMSGITTSTKIDGGIIEQRNGQLTGILIDNAMKPVEQLIPALPETIASGYLKKAEQECYSYGLTGVVDCGVTASVLKQLITLYNADELSIGNTALLSSDSLTIRKYVMGGPQYFGQFRITGIKLYADGALGSRGACLLQDYSDMPGHRGMLLTGMDEMRLLASDALKYNWQLCTHAIGDSANRTILKLYAEYLSGKNDLRWRIEHAQVVAREDNHYFGDYSVVPSVQPTHATSDMPWAETRLGPKRISTAYAYKDQLKQNGWIALGTDFPVEAIDPIATFYAAVARKDKQGNPKAGFLPENALAREEALNGMTIWAAKSVFNEKTKGSIESGKDADFVILDNDIMTIPENKILATRVSYTIVGGTIKYKSEEHKIKMADR